MYNAPYIKQLDPSLSILLSRVYNLLSFSVSFRTLRIATKTPASDHIDHDSIGTNPEAIFSPGTAVLSSPLRFIMGIAAKLRLGLNSCSCAMVNFLLRRYFRNPERVRIKSG